MAPSINEITALMKNIEVIRNISICAHIDHGKTTFSDNLMAGSGLMSKDLAGKVCALDYREDEQERGITIDSAAATMIFNQKNEDSKKSNKDYLINLIDTPGHVDFGGDVTRALRAVDGTIVLVCAVEGIMPQTQTVLKQALREGVKPILFINKVDRLITELKLSAEEIQKKLSLIISDFNNLLERYNAEDWIVSVNDSSVSFGSAVHNWALSLDFMNEKNIHFKDLIDLYEQKNIKQLGEKAPLYEVIFSSVIKHLPNPKTAQEKRLTLIWPGKQDSYLGKAISCADPKGPLSMMVIKIVSDKQGDTALTRIYSGTMKKNVMLHLNKNNSKEKAQQIYVWTGSKKLLVEGAVPAGNILGITGLKNAIPGETLSEQSIIEFKELKHIFDPVITKALETRKPSDLPKLEDALKHLPKEDPSIKVEINKDTGEYLISGNGELHLEITENRLMNNKGIEIISSKPIVLFKETLTAQGQNENNSLWFKASPLKKEDLLVFKNKKTITIVEDNVLINTFEAADDYKSSQKLKLEKINDTIKQVFKIIIKHGVLAGEQSTLMKIEVLGISLEEDVNYADVLRELKSSIMDAEPRLLEPRQLMELEVPPESIAQVTKIINSRFGKIENMYQGAYSTKISLKIAVENTFGFENELRSATAGKGSSFIMNQEFLPLTEEKEQLKLSEIRKRKGYRF